MLLKISKFQSFSSELKIALILTLFACTGVFMFFCITMSKNFNSFSDSQKAGYVIGAIIFALAPWELLNLLYQYIYYKYFFKPQIAENKKEFKKHLYGVPVMADVLNPENPVGLQRIPIKKKPEED